MLKGKIQLPVSNLSLILIFHVTLSHSLTFIIIMIAATPTVHACGLQDHCCCVSHKPRQIEGRHSAPPEGSCQIEIRVEGESGNETHFIQES
jgi:hypothetical protein